MLEGSLLKPPNFDPNRRYPVWFMTYGGPHAPTIHDSWGAVSLRDRDAGQHGLRRLPLRPAQRQRQGSLFDLDRLPAARRAGTEDIETAIRWLTATASVRRRQRIGMSGHSYGGFMTAFALTHSKLFAAGIAGAPVTDWRNYDTIYTERYMNTPQENPEGYDATSVVKAAQNLHGQLLIIHGLMDDNVHVQNTLQFVQTLAAGRQGFRDDVLSQRSPRHSRRGTTTADH